MEAYLNADEGPRKVCRHDGYDVFLEPNEGFYWSKGGYFDTIEACKRDIDDWNYQYEGEHPDSPCLGAPWWSMK